MTDHIRRIQFYTKKAAAYSRQKSRRNQYRFKRLMAYKAALNNRLVAAGYKWTPAIPLERGE